MATMPTGITSRPQQRRHEELMRILESRNVNVGSTMLEPKKSPGTIGEKGTMKLITNAHILKLLGTQSIYHYEVTINAVSARSDKKFCVSEPNGPRDRDDFPLLSRRDKCREVFLAFYQTMEQPLKDSGNVIYYDLSKTIFTLKKLQIESEGKFIFNIGTVPTTNHPDAARIKHYEFIIKPAIGFEIGDLSFVTNDVSKMERSLEQFLDIATAQLANLNGKQFIEFSSSRVYLLAPTDYGFGNNECPVFESNHSFLGVGANKGCRIIEGDQGPDQMTPCIVIQTKKSAFHIPDMCILDKAKSFIQKESLSDRIEKGELTQNDYDLICNGLVGIYAEPRYGTSGRYFRIDDITKPNSGNGHNAENTFINHKISGNISIKQYFQEHCQKTLRFPKAPLLINNRRMGEPAYYPMELCYVLDGQRVKGAQQNPDLLREMIKETAVPPTILHVHNERVKDSLQLVNNEYLTGASVRFDPTPLHVNYRIIAPPKLQYRGSNFQTPSSSCEWRPNSSLINAQFGSWVAYAFGMPQGDSVRRNTINETAWKAFIDKYIIEMRAKGVNCPAPSSVAVCWATSANEVFTVLNKEASKNIEFALIGHAKGSEGDDLHVIIKAFEQQTEIVTQAITFDIVRDVLDKGSPLTLANCVHKTNVKMGGLNYALHVDDPLVASLFDGHTLFLGFAMNYPGGFAPTESANNNHQTNGNFPTGSNGNAPVATNGNGLATGSNTVPLGSNGNAKPPAAGPRVGYSLPPPSCIGWAASIGKKHRDEYIGDFVYQIPRREEKIEVIASVVKQCLVRYKEKRNAFPKRFVVLRNGCAEGQFEYIMKYEIPLIKKEFEELGCDAKLTVLVPNRLQDVRFLRQDAKPEEKNSEQNICPGTVVDTVVVHPKRSEFFLNSHVAIKGTARTPHYTVLRDENGLSMDTIQTMVHYLCFMHQIVTKPTSLPSPVYIAEEYAKRGRNIFSHYSKNGLDNNKGLEKIVKNKGVPWPLRNYNDLTKVLSFAASIYLKDLRVNA